jgi:glucokinase
MGGTKVLSCAINSKDGIKARVKEPTDPESTPKEYIHNLALIVKKTISKSKLKDEQIAAVCLGIPGLVNPVTGIVGLAPNIGLKDINIKKMLEAELSFPILIENDVNVGALGIKNFGVGKKAKNLLAVFVGTGIGGGIIIDGKLYRGSDFAAGEIGHILVDKNGPVCGCGRKGCFEALASRTAIVNNIIADIKSGKKSVLQDKVNSGQRIKSKTLAAAVKDGDKVVIKRIEEGCIIIGEVLASLTNFMNFDMIVLGGGMIDALDNFMLPIIKKSFDSRVLEVSAKNLKILVTHLGDDAALFGGISLAKEFLGIEV